MTDGEQHHPEPVARTGPRRTWQAKLSTAMIALGVVLLVLAVLIRL